MSREHLRGRRSLAIKFGPVPLDALSLCASPAYGEVERECAMTPLIVTLQVKFGYERSKMDHCAMNAGQVGKWDADPLGQLR